MSANVREAVWTQTLHSVGVDARDRMLHEAREVMTQRGHDIHLKETRIRTVL
ncbi:hypothetical protein [Candidimonas sp. SYP-B2681]|uniref:hypothetical protein n=1 Tax=Candidimonas sp. SYP-B2681 TaxID=2497686 RepID=UPI0013155903|nr:hypothetical protein [Candidimonas sp. SYP-B2681]